MTETAVDALPEDQSTPESSRTWRTRLRMPLIVTAIVGVQCALAYVLLPSMGEAARPDPKADSTPVRQSFVPADDSGEHREADLGKFSLTSFDPNSNTTLLIDFHLYGIVAIEQDDTKRAGSGGQADRRNSDPETDNSRFGILFRKNKHRFREQVIVTIRNAQMTDLADPGLGLIKRQILAKSNSLLGEPLLKEVIFSDFAVVEQ
jgi:hypothetical protein